jgi:hypothetical protein
MKKIFSLLLSLLLSASFLFAQHYKKDGTPDRRYKENKTYSAPSSATPSYSSPSYSSPSSYGTHLKRDGTPDGRYKENRSYSTPSYPKQSYSAPSYSAPSYPKQSHSTPSYSVPTNKTKNYYFLERDKNGKIKRSESAKHDFMKQTGYPNGRPGYVIDHIKPLSKGGCDCPENMQWQTKEAAKEKDKWERK